MRKQVFGFDIGIASIGWAVINFSSEKFNLETGELYVASLQKLSFKEFINLSLKALHKINPFLEEGLIYNEACEKAGYRIWKGSYKLFRKLFRLLINSLH